MRAWTLPFIVAALVVILGFDVFQVVKGGTEATISYWIYNASYEYPTIPFAFGFLCGHFFFGLHSYKPKEIK
jgi:hypothetical protein